MDEPVLDAHGWRRSRRRSSRRRRRRGRVTGSSSKGRPAERGLVWVVPVFKLFEFTLGAVETHRRVGPGDGRRGREGARCRCPSPCASLGAQVVRRGAATEEHSDEGEDEPQLRPFDGFKIEASDKVALMPGGDPVWMRPSSPLDGSSRGWRRPRPSSSTTTPACGPTSPVRDRVARRARRLARRGRCAPDRLDSAALLRGHVVAPSYHRLSLPRRAGRAMTTAVDEHGLAARGVRRLARRRPRQDTGDARGEGDQQGRSATRSRRSRSTSTSSRRSTETR